MLTVSNYDRENMTRMIIPKITGYKLLHQVKTDEISSTYKNKNPRDGRNLNDLCCKEYVRKADFEDEFEFAYGSAFFKNLIIDEGLRFWIRYWR